MYIKRTKKLKTSLKQLQEVGEFLGLVKGHLGSRQPRRHISGIYSSCCMQYGKTAFIVNYDIAML